MKLAFLVASLTNEITHFIKNYPHTKPAGLLLSVDVLLPVYEEIDGLVLNQPDDVLPHTLKQAELKALRKAASGQIARLYQLTNLLIQPDTLDRSVDDLKQIGLQVRDATSILEDTLHAIVEPMVNDPESDPPPYDIV